MQSRAHGQECSSYMKMRIQQKHKLQLLAQSGEDKADTTTLRLDLLTCRVRHHVRPTAESGHIFKVLIHRPLHIIT